MVGRGQSLARVRKRESWAERRRSAGREGRSLAGAGRRRSCGCFRAALPAVCQASAVSARRGLTVGRSPRRRSPQLLSGPIRDLGMRGEAGAEREDDGFGEAVDSGYC